MKSHTPAGGLPALLSLTLVAVILTAAGPSVAEDGPSGVRQRSPFDWPHWRGPEQNGISRETGLVDRWSPDGENVLWHNEELASRSTPIVMTDRSGRPRLYTIARDQPDTKFETEKVVCVDALTGDVLWEHRTNLFLCGVPAERIGWSNVVGDPETGHVFVHGVQNYLKCLDGETGEELWGRSLAEEYGALNTYGGRTNTPIVHEELVIISAVCINWGDLARPQHRFIAFDKRNGQPVWFEGTRPLPYDTTYSTPITAVIDGEAVMVAGSGDGGVHAFQPRTGKRLWTYNVSRRGIYTTPLIAGDRVYCGHAEENLDSNEMGALFAIDATQRGDVTRSGELWRVNGWYVGRAAPLYVDGRLYGPDDRGTLWVVDPEAGSLIASEKVRGVVRGSPVYADGKIFLCTENGIWWTFRPTEDGIEVVHRARLSLGEALGSPIVSHGRIFVPTSSGLYCVGREGHEPQADPIPSPPQEAPAAADRTPAQLQVVPVESLLKPGQRQKFSARLYNASGQYLGTPEELGRTVEFRVSGPGAIDAEGRYTTDENGGHAAVMVTATGDGLEGQSRARIVPPLPWIFDFDNGEIPVTWVGARYRHIPLDFEFYKSLESENPRAAQLYIALMTTFVNGDTETAKYDDSTPRRDWTEFLRYLGLLGQVTTLEQAREELDPALEVLRRENFITEWTWARPEGIGIQLTAGRGPRQIDDGNGVMCKITTIPLGTKSQGWMGHADESNYTIQADVYGATRGGRIPDIGLIAQRYTIDLMGDHQQLQIRTWPPQEHSYFVETVPFEWRPDTWYTMKLQASVEGGKAVLKGKVWPRDADEPDEWTIEVVDENANVIGSPGLFGNATYAEIFYDNLTVTPNP